jgi:hypothetical protein
VNILIHVFLASALVAGEWLASSFNRFATGERVPDAHRIGGWVGPRTGLYYMKKRKILPVPELEASSQSLYRLRYPSSCECWVIH